MAADVWQYVNGVGEEGGQKENDTEIRKKVKKKERKRKGV